MGKQTFEFKLRHTFETNRGTDVWFQTVTDILFRNGGQTYDESCERQLKGTLMHYNCDTPTNIVTYISFARAYKGGWDKLIHKKSKFNSVFITRRIHLPFGDVCLFLHLLQIYLESKHSKWNVVTF